MVRYGDPQVNRRDRHERKPALGAESHKNGGERQPSEPNEVRPPTQYVTSLEHASQRESIMNLQYEKMCARPSRLGKNAHAGRVGGRSTG